VFVRVSRPRSTRHFFLRCIEGGGEVGGNRENRCFYFIRLLACSYLPPAPAPVRFFFKPPRGGLDFVTNKAGRHLVGIYTVTRAGLKAWLGVHIAIVGGLFVVVVASTGVLALVPWGVRGLDEAPAVEHKPCPSTMGGKSPCAIKHPAVVGLNRLRPSVAVVREMLRCQCLCYFVGDEVDVLRHLFFFMFICPPLSPPPSLYLYISFVFRGCRSIARLFFQRLVRHVALRLSHLGFPAWELQGTRKLPEFVSRSSPRKGL